MMSFEKCRRLSGMSDESNTLDLENLIIKGNKEEIVLFINKAKKAIKLQEKLDAI